MKRRRKFNILAIIILILLAVIVILYAVSRPPEYVTTDNRVVGVYRTRNLHQIEGPIHELEPNQELRYLDHIIRHKDYFWEGAIKVEFENQDGEVQEGWVDFRYLSPESREALQKAARF